jgi:hypothetical protein
MPAEREAREPVPRATKITAQSGRSQIAPLRVARLDQFELPFAMPAFALFAKDRSIDLVVEFPIDQSFTACV